MHELALTESILKIVVSEGKKSGASRVLSIKLKLGEYSDVIPHYITQYFGIVSRGSIAENASIVVERIPASVLCRSCGYEGAVDRKVIKCPKCGSDDLKMLSGREFYVDSIELE